MFYSILLPRIIFVLNDFILLSTLEVSFYSQSKDASFDMFGIAFLK